MKGACSTLKEEGRPADANTTKLSDRGASSIAGMAPARNAWDAAFQAIPGFSVTILLDSASTVKRATAANATFRHSAH
jgi:hypothetical protein